MNKEQGILNDEGLKIVICNSSSFATIMPGVCVCNLLYKVVRPRQPEQVNLLPKFVRPRQPKHAI